MSSRIIVGDCLDVMPTLDACSVDAIVCDPPYGLSFMGKDWDHGVPGEHFWSEALRVAKPGAHLVAFGGTRTHHRLMCAIEDAGWQIRDTIGWLYGSGFPKSLDVSKAIDKAAGEERELVTRVRADGKSTGNSGGSFNACDVSQVSGEPITIAARQWQGWGTALKPAWEPIILARKPLAGTVAANVLQHGTGGLNIDGCRIEIDPSVDDARLGGNGDWASDKMAKNVYEGGYAGNRVGSSPLGRWPANIIHDGSEEVLAVFPESDGQLCDASNDPESRRSQNVYGTLKRVGEPSENRRYTDEGSTNFAALPGARRGDSGSAARFFYCAKADREDRNAGVHHLPRKPLNWSSGMQSPGTFQAEGTDRNASNHHPTVKPTDLMRYLCRLVTPPGGLILDPFCGSGSTGKAAILEGFRFIGIELSEEYAEIAKARIYGTAPLFAQELLA